MKATVIQAHSELHQTVWRFFWSERMGVVLDFWRDEKRPTRRHKFKASQSDGTAWDRYETRYNRIDQPTPPESVRNEALQKLRSQIVFAD